jgi:hypothetical protein
VRERSITGTGIAFDGWHDMDSERERMIRETWENLGRVLWNAPSHGSGQSLMVGGFLYRAEERDIRRGTPRIMCEDIVVVV